MYSILKKALGMDSPRTITEVAQPIADFEDDDIPRYPPFAKGLPSANLDKVLATQNLLIERIRTSLGFTREEHEHLILPVIRRYASFVHLLPASEAHHHRGAGGLFRHGLEVAFWAAQGSESVLFSMAGSPRERRNNEPRWRLASCFAGMLHDVGKPLSDVSVTDKEGSHEWNPYSSTLYQWATDNEIERYFLRWRDNRHKRHEQFSLLAIERIIPHDVLQYLSQGGPVILEAMLEAIAGTGTTQPITRLMLKADQESVARDLKQSRMEVDEFAYGVPVERYVFDAIRRLVTSGKWKTNEPGEKVWHVHQGVFIVWRNLGDLYDLIQRDNIPGIPRDPDTLADILIERGFALTNTQMTEDGESAHYRYWELCPESIQPDETDEGVKLMALRLESPELVFTSEPPPPVPAKLIGETEEPKIAFEDIDESILGSEFDEAEVSEQDTPESAEASNRDKSGIDFSEAAAMADMAAAKDTGTDDTHSNFDAFDMSVFGMSVPEAKPTKDAGSAASEDKASPAKPQPEKTETSLSAKPKSEAVSDPAPAPASEPASEPEPEPNPKPESSDKSIPSQAPTPRKERTDKTKPAAANKPKKKSGNKTANILNDVLTKQSKSQPIQPAVSEPKSMTPKDELSAALDGVSETAAGIIRSAVEPILDGDALMGEVLIKLQGELAIVYPEGADKLGESAKAVMDCLSEAGVIASDPVMPGRRVQAHRGIKGLVLEKRLSTQLLKVLKDVYDTDESDMLSLLTQSEKTTNKKPPKSVGSKQAKIPQSQSRKRKKMAVPDTPKLETPRPEKGISIHKKASVSATPKAAEIPELDEKGLLEKGKGVMTADFDEISPKPISRIEVVEQLKQMILQRHGKWIVGEVIRDGNQLITSDKCLDMIAVEHQLSRSQITPTLRQSRTPGKLERRQQKIYLTLKDSEQKHEK